MPQPYTRPRIIVRGSASAPPPPPPASQILRVVPFNLKALDQGPGNNVGTPRWGGGGPLIPSSDSELNGLIDLADELDRLLVLNLADSRDNWAPGGEFSFTLYRARVEAWAGNAKLRDAFQRRRAIPMVIDEPFHPTEFNGSCSTRDVNDLGLLHKSIWPGVVTWVRCSSKFLKDGWPNDDGIVGPPPGGYTGLDYAGSQFESHHVPSAGETISAFFTRERNECAALNMGTVPGINFWSGGNYFLHDGVPHCWDIEDNGSSSGVIKGTFSGVVPAGTKINCGHASIGTTETRFAVSPPYFRRFMDVVCGHAFAAEWPFISIWTYPYSNFQHLSWTNPLWLRADFVTEFDYGITLGEAQLVQNRWRQIK